MLRIGLLAALALAVPCSPSRDPDAGSRLLSWAKSRGMNTVLQLEESEERRGDFRAVALRCGVSLQRLCVLLCVVLSNILGAEISSAVRCFFPLRKRGF